MNIRGGTSHGGIGGNSVEVDESAVDRRFAIESIDKARGSVASRGHEEIGNSCFVAFEFAETGFSSWTTAPSFSYCPFWCYAPSWPYSTSWHFPLASSCYS